MKILMIGRGVIATMYGWALERAGHSTEFYVRPGRAAQYGPTLAIDLLDARTRIQGVQIKDTFATRFVEDLPADHEYDLIVVSVQHYRFAEVVDFLIGRIGNATVLLFSNLWIDPHEAVSSLPADRLVWGFPGTGGGIQPGGVLRGGLLKNVKFGDFGTDSRSGSRALPTPRERAVRELFRGAGFGIQVQHDFRGWLWTHFLINAALLPQALRAGSFAKLMNSDAHLRQAVLNVRELLPVLAARRVDFKLHAADLGLFSMPPGFGALLLRLAYLWVAPVRRVVQSALPGDDLGREVKPISRDMLLEAERLGIAVPRLAAFEAMFSEAAKRPDPEFVPAVPVP